MGGVMHTIADGWRFQVLTMLRTAEKLWVEIKPESGLNYQVPAKGGALVMSERNTLP
jgi:hypothetical protein